MTHNLFALRWDLCTISIKAFRTVLTFLSFKGLTHAYLVKTSITHIKHLVFINNGFNSSKSASRIFCLFGLSLFWKSKERGREGGGKKKPTMKKHAVSQKIFVHFTWNFVHMLYWQYGISMDKEIDKCYFPNHPNSHVLAFFKIFSNWCISSC